MITFSSEHGKQEKKTGSRASLLTPKAYPQGHTSSPTVVLPKNSITFLYNTTNWGLSDQMHESMRDIFIQPHHRLLL